MRSYIYTIITVPVFGILYLFTAVTVILLIVFSYLNWGWGVRAGIRFWAKTSFLFMGKRLRIVGMENFNENKKYVLIANHASLFDIMAVMAFHPKVSWFGHVRLTKVPVFKKLLEMIDYIPVDRSSIKNTRPMIEQLVEKSKGLTVAIFPEGTRTTDGNINKFYRGFIHVLRASDMELLPVTLNGFYDLKPKNRFYIKFNSKINVVIHKPIVNKDLTNKEDKRILTEAKEIIESAYI